MSNLKALQAQLLQQQIALTQAQQAAEAKAMAPDPNLQKLIGVNNSIVDWNTGASGIKDVYKNPTIGSSLPVYQLAMSNRDLNRSGKGIASLNAGGTSGATGSYTPDLNLEDNYRRQQAASGALETGLTNQFANAQSNLAALTGQQTNANLQGTGLSIGTSSQLGNMMNQVNQRIQQGGFWSSLGRGLLKYGVPIAANIFAPGLGTLASGAINGTSGGAGGGAGSIPASYGGAWS